MKSLREKEPIRRIINGIIGNEVMLAFLCFVGASITLGAGLGFFMASFLSDKLPDWVALPAVGIVYLGSWLISIVWDME